MDEIDFSSIAVTFQAVGTLLLALVMAQLGRIFAWRYAWRWSLAWASMFAAITAVRIFIATGNHAWWLVYVLAEWFFLLLLYVGCRELVEDSELPLRPFAFALPAAVALGIVLINVADTFNALFDVQAGIVAISLFASFTTLRRVPPARRTGGWQMMRLSIALLMILFACYVPLYTLYQSGVDFDFLTYSSLADLLGSMLLGFSMILVTSEEANRSLRDAVDALQCVRDQLEEKLRVDPLTDALSRHAFYAMPRGINGVVIMIDIDHLKRVNDEIGHAAGDAVIRAAANAIRTRIRADDLLFRWGGDEFLAIMPNTTLDLVQERLAGLTDPITAEAGERVVTFQLSWGGAPFGDTKTLEEAMRVADATMYERRSAARQAG